jgi:hypothetical protein
MYIFCQVNTTKQEYLSVLIQTFHQYNFVILSYLVKPKPDAFVIVHMFVRLLSLYQITSKPSMCSDINLKHEGMSYMKTAVLFESTLQVNVLFIFFLTIVGV